MNLEQLAVELIIECDEYLNDKHPGGNRSANPINTISSSSMLHNKMKAVIAAYRQEKSLPIYFDATVLLERYNQAREGKVNEVINCPSCNFGFVKKHYQQVFCCNDGVGNCKDHYWNTIKPERRGHCTACAQIGRGVKFRVAPVHTCGK